MYLIIAWAILVNVVLIKASGVDLKEDTDCGK